MEQQREARLGEVQSESRELVIPDEEEEVVAGILESPLVVTDGGGNEIEINRARFIRYYLPKGATEEEIFHCYQQTRITGLNPMIPGECHYFKTGGGPMRLYTGYPVYLKKAYAAGLQHIQKPEITFDENGKPLECTITLQIAGRPDFSWTTWFDEVKAVDANGKLNKRWMKAGIFQFIKCSVVNTLRWSGLVDFSLPYIVEEMGDPVADGYRTLTQEQLDAHEPEDATMGEVTAASHQIDTSEFRIEYFKSLKKMGLVFETDEERRVWQKKELEIESVANLTVSEWIGVMVKIADMRAEQDFDNEEYEKTKKSLPDKPKKSETEEQNAPEGGTEGMSAALKLFLSEAEVKFETVADRDKWISTVVSQKPINEWSVSECAMATEALMKLPEREIQEFAEDLTPDDTHGEVEKIVKEVYADSVKAPVSGTEEPTPDNTREEEEKPQEQGKEAAQQGEDEEDKAMKAWRGTPIRDPQVDRIRDLSLEIEEFKPHGIMSDAWHEFFEELFEEPVRGLKLLLYEEGEKLIEALEGKLSGGDDSEAPDEPLLVTKETYQAIKDVLIQFPDHRYLTIKSRAFKERAGGIIGCSFTSLKNVLDTDAQEILLVLKGECREAMEAHEQGEALLDDPMTDEQFEKFTELVIDMPQRFHGSVGSEAFRAFVLVTIKRQPDRVKMMTEAEADDVILAMQDMIAEEKQGAGSKPHVV